MYGFKCAYIHHQGSIAFGAFIIALIRFIKFFLYYLAKKMEKASGDNGAVKAAAKCAICLLSCIEKICDYLNESAFCYMAVTGNWFLTSAW
jgi:choline transporter-like protein 2/4/5